MSKTDFLHVSLSLRDNTYDSFKKKKCKVVYIHNQSNHPKLIRKYTTPIISKRLDKLSSNSLIFENSKKPYKPYQALADSGHNLIHHAHSSQTTSKNSRNIARKKIIFQSCF